AAEKQTLEKMANGASLSEVLNDLCVSIDAHGSPVTSMVCLLDGEWLSPCAGPHIPATFKAAITPWRIGPDRASCGAAAITKQRVIVPNISNDPRWPDDARDLTLSHGFVAAWSEPLISKDGEVLGTFAMYYPEARTPKSNDFELIAGAGHIARIAIEIEQSHLALKKALVEIKNSENRLADHHRHDSHLGLSFSSRRLGRILQPTLAGLLRPFFERGIRLGMDICRTPRRSEQGRRVLAIDSCIGRVRRNRGAPPTLRRGASLVYLSRQPATR